MNPIFYHMLSQWWKVFLPAAPVQFVPLIKDDAHGTSE
jgi:hypothetical protein